MGSSETSPSAVGSPEPQCPQCHGVPSASAQHQQQCHPRAQHSVPPVPPSVPHRVLTCGRKLLGLWPATQDNSRARSSAPNFHQPDSVILQVGRHSRGSDPPKSEDEELPSPHPDPLPLLQIDFPTSAFEVKFTNPPPAEASPRYEFGSLGEEDQRQLREAMQKKSLYW